MRQFQFMNSTTVQFSLFTNHLAEILQTHNTIYQTFTVYIKYTLADLIITTFEISLITMLSRIQFHVYWDTHG